MKAMEEMREIYNKLSYDNKKILYLLAQGMEISQKNIKNQK